MTVYLRNAAGFFLQLYPCMLMLFLPFPKEAYRFPLRWILGGVTVSAVGLAALFPAVLYGAKNWDVPFVCNLFALATAFLTLAACIRLVREALLKKILVFVVVLFYAAAQYWLVNALNGLLREVEPLSLQLEGWAVYSTQGLVMYAATTAVLLPLMLRFMLPPLREYIREVDPQKAPREFFVLIASSSVFILLIVTVDLAYYRLTYRQYLQQLPLFLALLLDQMLLFWLVCRESVRRRHDDARRRALEIQQLQYEKIAGDMENTRRMRHDMHHHYNTLREMLEKGELEPMREYLSRLSDADARPTNRIYCGNLTVNALLQYYAGLAKDKGIRCEIQAECAALSIEPADLTVLFGNAMENAIRACEKCGGGRWIRVQVGTVQSSLAIEISNSCTGVRLDRRYQTADGFCPAQAFLSDRPDGGYGLQSIAHTAQKYGGSAKFRYNAEKNVFTARMRLNMHTDV